MARRIAVFCLALLTLPAGAGALDQCRVKQARDGTLLVRASGADPDGVPRWSWSEPAPGAGRPFANQESCSRDGSWKDCTLADEGDPDRVIPPPLCTLTLSDGSESCTATLKNCVAGLRPTCPPDMERVGRFCIERQANQQATRSTALAVCQARGRSLCDVEPILSCDSLNLSKSRPGSCGDRTDGRSRYLWMEGTREDGTGSSVYGDLLCYDAFDNSFSVFDNCDDDQNDAVEYFCCAPLGAL